MAATGSDNLEENRVKAAEARVAEGAGWMASGALWLVGARWLVRFSGLINMIVLARIMTPHDYSVVAIATMIVLGTEMLMDFSPELTLVQRKEALKGHFDAVFSFTVIRNTIIAIVFFLAAPWIADYFGEPVLVYLLYTLCVTTFINGFYNQGAAAFSRELDYRKYTIVRAVPKLTSVVVAISLAVLIWPDYRALIAATATNSILGTALSYWLHPYRPRFNLSHWRDVFGASAGLLGFNLCNYLFLESHVFFVAKIVGTSLVSIFALAVELAKMVVTELAGPVSHSLILGFSRLQDDAQEMQRQFQLALGVLFVITAPMAVGIALVAEPAVRLLFGAQWMAAAPIVEILWIAGLTTVLSRTIMSVMIAKSQQTGLMWAYGVGTVIMVAAMLVLGPDYGLEGMAWATVLGYLIVLIIEIAITRRRLGLRFDWFLREALRPAFACGVMALAVWAVEPLAPGVESTLDAALSLILQAFTGAVAYTLALIGLWLALGAPDGPERNVLNLLAGKFPAIARLLPDGATA
ncbi:MAG: lipopolysaccharide biosynthesis protein [Neomegalonema sp.]|nr:lipopolysaccharide biosynthesis protein [Neomegalonema sp.]